MSLHDRIRFQPVDAADPGSYDGQPVLDTTDGAAGLGAAPGGPDVRRAARADLTATLTPCADPGAPSRSPPVLGPVQLRAGTSTTAQSFDVERRRPRRSRPLASARPTPTSAAG